MEIAEWPNQLDAIARAQRKLLSLFGFKVITP
jgi:hypothetical protein